MKDFTVDTELQRLLRAQRPYAQIAMPEAPTDDGLDVTDCSGIQKGNSDLESHPYLDGPSHE